MTTRLAWAAPPQPVHQQYAPTWTPLPEQQQQTAPPAPAPVADPGYVPPMIPAPPKSLADLQALGPAAPTGTGDVPQVAFATDLDVSAPPPTGRFYMVLLADRTPSCDGRMVNSPTLAPMPLSLANSHWDDAAAAIIGRIERTWWATAADGRLLLIGNGVFDLNDKSENGGYEYARLAWQGMLRQSSVEFGSMKSLWDMWADIDFDDWDTPWPGDPNYEGIDGWEDAREVWTGIIRASAITRGPAMEAAMCGLDPAFIPQDYAGQHQSVPLDNPNVVYGQQLVASIGTARPVMAGAQQQLELITNPVHRAVWESTSLVASVGVPVHIRRPAMSKLRERAHAKAVTASGGVAERVYVAPKTPPVSWFEAPDPALGPMNTTITPEGRVYGYFALRNDPVTGRPTKHLSVGVDVPFGLDYRPFNDGDFDVAVGDGTTKVIKVGTLVYGGPHANDLADFGQARDVYASTSAVWAYVIAGENSVGGWFAGVLRHTLDPDDIPLIRVCAVSGDWRWHEGLGAQSLCSVLSVPTPGFGYGHGTQPGDLYTLAASGKPRTLILRCPTVPLVAAAHPTARPAAASLLSRIRRQQLAARADASRR